MSTVGEITPAELAEARKSATPPLVIDVREGWELGVAALPDVTHIPMQQIPARVGELDKDRDIVVMCRSGGRSMQVAQYLAANGFRSVKNLTGGILRWGQDVDPSIPPY